MERRWGREARLCDADIPDEKKVENLLDKLIADHLPAVLAWAAEAAKEYHESGLGEVPELVRVTNEEYAYESDPLQQFLDQRCETDDADISVSATRLYLAYKDWWHAQGNDYALSQKAFSDHMTSKGYKKVHRRSGRPFLGVKLPDRGYRTHL